MDSLIQSALHYESVWNIPLPQPALTTFRLSSKSDMFIALQIALYNCIKVASIDIGGFQNVSRNPKYLI